MRSLFLAYPVLGLLLGLVVFLLPSWFERGPKERRAQRLAELDAGDEERFFEERRSLKAYKPLTAYGLRILGAALAIASIFMMIVGPSAR